MKAMETNMLYAKGSNTIGGTAMEKALKKYVDERFNKAIIEDRLLRVVFGEIQGKQKELLAANPRLKAVELNVENDVHDLYGTVNKRPATYWITAGNETILTLSTCSRAYFVNGNFENYVQHFDPA